MKLKLIIILKLIVVLIICSCPSPTDTEKAGDTPGNQDKRPIGLVENITLTDSAEAIKMIYANNSASTAFPVGNNNVRTILNHKFWIAETEFTNAQAIIVLQWSYDQGYLSNNVNDHNGLDTTTIKYGGYELIDIDDQNCQIVFDNTSNLFSVKTGYENHPVTNITWYGTIMMCNWLTEMTDGNKDNIVYTNKDSTLENENWEIIQDLAKTGFRLPVPDEWEYAARYRGDDPTNTIDNYSNPYYTKPDSMSGAISKYTHILDSKLVAVFKAYLSDDPTDEAPVKSLGENSCNTLGVFDMSGNISEWCFPDSKLNDEPEKRGGAWNNIDLYCTVTGSSLELPYSDLNNLGFRIYRTEK